MKNPNIQFKATVRLVIALLFVCFGLSPAAQAQLPSPSPDGGYPGRNTAEGQWALFHLTTGQFNTAVGFGSLTTNTSGDNNTATGAGALSSNIDGSHNTATGLGALVLNAHGNHNTADGFQALENNTTGSGSTAMGAGALQANNGQRNTAYGFIALTANMTGNDNTAIGQSAGSNQTSGSNNVYIGSGMSGVAGENNACYIKSIFGQHATGGIPVFITGLNKLGTEMSSKRFKIDIKPMDKASEGLFSLKPVSFHYKKEIDPAGTAQLGLVAEEVEKVNPDLVVRDKEGKPYTVRYDQVNAMLLNEFLKEHKKVQNLEATVTQQQKGMEVLAAQLKEQALQIEKVSDQLQAVRSVPRLVLNNE
jgi:hypothetical protein